MKRKYYVVVGLGTEENKRWEDGINSKRRAMAVGELLFVKLNLLERFKLWQWSNANGLNLTIRKPLPMV